MVRQLSSTFPAKITVSFIVALFTSIAHALPQGPMRTQMAGYLRPRTGGDWYFMFVNNSGGVVDYSNGLWEVERMGVSTPVGAWGLVADGDVTILTNMTVAAFRARWQLTTTVPPVVGGSLITLPASGTINLFDTAILIDSLVYTAPTASGPAPARQCPSGFLGDMNDANWVDARDGDVFGSYLSSPAGSFVGNPREWLAPLRPIGGPYCMANPNSTGVVSRCDGTGSTSVANNDVTISARDLPPFTFGFFITSRTQGFIMNAGGSDGNLCLAAPLGRFVGPGQIQDSGPAGTFSLAVDLTQVPQPMGSVAVLPGDTWNFQAWFRDANPASTSNFTEGLEIQFN